MIKFEFELRTDIGTRDEQQDYADVHTNSGMVFAVLCDGMGGHNGGSIASQTAVKYFINEFNTINNENIPAFFIERAEKANKKIYDLADQNGRRLNAGTTLVSVIIKENNLYWLSIGDSRLYIIRNNKIKQITKDHNYFFILDNMLKENKITSEEYASRRKKGSALISYLGIKKLDLIDINIEPFYLYPNDLILLTSDGLLKAMNEEMIVESLCLSITESADRLINFVKKSKISSKDNTTFILIKLKENE